MNAPLPATAAPIPDSLLAEVRRGLNANERLVDALEARLCIDPAEFTARLGATFELSALTSDELCACEPDFDSLPYTECARRGCMLLRRAGASALLLTDDPFDNALSAWAEAQVEFPFELALVARRELRAMLSAREETLRALDSLPGVAPDTEEQERPEDLSLGAIDGEASTIIRLIRSTLRDALRAGASDIHLESSAEGLTIRFRIDGILSQAKLMQDTAQGEQAIARVKVLANLDITERRVPQDGRFKALDSGRTIDFRVSIMPSIHGEDAVLRVLDKHVLQEDGRHELSLDTLGLDAREVSLLRRLAREPHGMLLVTGPTGSGKTTTLYAAITEINDGRHKIVTIEDPVEYQLPGILQIPVNEKKGLTFARGLRSILRHDPDQIMVGEIRDPETAGIAVQSALTGHLVFTTVHANNVFDVIGRFVHMNVDLYGFVSALNAILAQRLIRTLCPHCAIPTELAPLVLEQAGFNKAELSAATFRAGAGCRECRGTGFKGRKAIAELLILNDEMRELIIARAPIRAVKEAAFRAGARTLRASALQAVERGETTLDEVNRVTSMA